MFRSPFLNGFPDDPFFSGYPNQHMRQMEGIFDGFHDPFMMNDMRGRHHHENRLDHHVSSSMNRDREQLYPNNRGRSMMPFDMFGGNPGAGFMNPFTSMQRMMDNMNRMMQPGFENAPVDPSSHTYAHSSVMSYASNGEAEPQIYQATSSTRTAPGGVTETRKTVRDSLSGENKMMIGHHLQGRGHEIERSQNRRAGTNEENHNFINIDEEEAEQFDEEWHSQVGHIASIEPRQRPQHRHRRRDGQHDRRAITDQ